MHPVSCEIISSVMANLGALIAIGVYVGLKVIAFLGLRFLGAGGGGMVVWSRLRSGRGRIWRG